MDIPGKEPVQQPPPAGQEPAPAQSLNQVDLDARLSELEGFLSERDKEIAELKKSLEIAHSNVAANGAAEIESKKAVQAAQEAIQEGQKAIQERDKALAVVLTAYRAAILQAHPDIPEEMVTGSTLDELQGSLDKAKVLVQKIREKMPLVVQAPAGAPVRSVPDVSAMSPREKIVHGLRK